jgi:hypothetical protein
LLSSLTDLGMSVKGPQGGIMAQSITPGIFLSRVSTTRHGEFTDDFNVPAQALIDQAKKFVSDLDAADGQSQTALAIDLGLRTVLTAISAGLNQNRWDTVAEAYVMLQQIERSVREEAKPIKVVRTN